MPIFECKNLIVKSRLRGDNISNLKNLDLLFDIPDFKSTASQGRENVTKVQATLGNIRDSDKFNAEVQYSNRDSISNFEKLDVVTKKIRRTAMLCNLSENHCKVLLQGFCLFPTHDQ